jgi:hypothetical protein
MELASREYSWELVAAQGFLINDPGETADEDW